MAKPRRSSSVPVNPEEWSESSKRSYIYQSPPTEYKDYHYKCWRCQQPSIFTAEAQLRTYEVRKAYIWQKRKLCTACFDMRVQIEAELKVCAEGWKLHRPALESNSEFLRRWLTLLEDHVHYGGSADEGNTNMLRRLLSENERRILTSRADRGTTCYD